MDNYIMDLYQDQLETPVLFITFRRPDTTRKVFERIRQAQPKRLYTAQNFPSSDNTEEIRKWKDVRAIIENVDWDCDTRRLYRERYLDVKTSVSSAIDWFFENVEEGIILEDDCLPDQSFFQFSEIMLEKYRNDTRIMMISGTNFLFNKVTISESYFFSKYYAIWGWATWRRAWMKYDIDMNNWPEFRNNKQLTRVFGDKKIIEYYTNMFQAAYNNKINTWDIQWVYSCILNNGLSVVPGKNLIANIGVIGTHTSPKPSIFINMPTGTINVNNIKHPVFVTPNILCDKIAYYIILTNGNKLKSVIIKFLKRIKIYDYIHTIYRKLKSI
jgi:hypothetical protein